MLLILILLFIVLPTVELGLLYSLSNEIGLGRTMLIALGTGVLGASLTRSQGLATLARISRQMAGGEVPTDALVDGAMILVAGAVLITPGILTDAFGFSLLLPPVRAVLKPLLKAALRRRLKRHPGGVEVWSFGKAPPGSPAGPAGGEILEGEILEVRTKDADSPEG